MNIFKSLLGQNYVVIAIFLLVHLSISVWFHRKVRVRSFQEYMLTSRSLSTGVLVMVLLSTFLDKGFLSFVGCAYEYGILNLLFCFSIIVSFWLIGTFLVPHLAFFNNYLTLGEMMRDFYGSFTQFVTGIAGSIVSFSIALLQIRMIGIMSHHLLGMDASLTILCFGVCFMLYSVLYDIRIMGYLDILQMIGIFLVLNWIMKTLVVKSGGVNAIVQNLSEKHPEKLIFWDRAYFSRMLKPIFFWIFSGTFMLSPPTVQRMLTIQDKRQMKYMWYTSATFVVLISGMATLIGLGTLSLSDKLGVGDEDENYKLCLYLIKKLFEGQYWTQQCLFLSLLSIMASTMDAYLRIWGISFVQDLIAPVRAWYKWPALNVRQQMLWARIGNAAMILLVIFIGYIKIPFKMIKMLERLNVLISGIVIFPLTVGIMGMKTDKKAWVSFSLTYTTTIVILFLHGVEMFDYFLIALLLGMFAYFATHIIDNKGIVVLQRNKDTICQQLWIPSCSSTKKFLERWLTLPPRLSTLARMHVLKYPIHTLSFSAMIFMVYSFFSIISCDKGQDAFATNVMVYVHGIAFALCCLLILEDFWPANLKPYFPLFWFFTLLYCLPFGGTLKLLVMHEGTCAVSHWVTSYVLLALLVGSSGFFIIASLGTSTSFLLYYLYTGFIPKSLWHDTFMGGLFCLIAILVGVFLFIRKKEGQDKQHLYLNQVASGSLAHEIRHSLQMLGGVGHALNNAFREGHTMQDQQGKGGFWIPDHRYLFLNKFSGEMIEEAHEGSKDLDRFTKFIEQQVFGVFEQQEVSMLALVKEGTQRISKQYDGKVEITITCPKDFKAKLLATVFPNVILNLVKNAYRHGHASCVHITVDGTKRKLFVRDNGQGIPQHILPHIFDLFFTSGQGTGVGLAFLKMVIEASGGKVSCTSQHEGQDSFTEFIMELP